MIVDTLENVAKLDLGPRFAKAFAWLRDPANAALPAGHHVIETAPDGTETLFANVQEYDTRDPKDCRLEFHRRYADIQFLFEGNEAIGWRPLSDGLPVTQPYSEKDDIGFVAGEGAPVPFAPGVCFVLFPQDAHAPGQRTPAAARVKKAIVKVLL